jgi:serine/threonine-protein kinase
MAKMVDAAWGHATQSGTLVGTPFYMSPEQAEGKPDQGLEADVWSMGVLFYRCLSGKLPFHADSPTALLLAIVNAKPAPLREAAPDVPVAIAAVIDRALVADRTERWPDMRTLLSELQRAAGASGVAFPSLPDGSAHEPGEPFDPGPPISPEPGAGPRGARIAIAAAVAVVLAAAATFALTRDEGAAAREGEPSTAEEPSVASAPSEVSATSAREGPRESGRAESEPTASAVGERGTEIVEAAAERVARPPVDRPSAASGAPRERAARPRVGAGEPTAEQAEERASEEPVPATKRLPGVAREW